MNRPSSIERRQTAAVELAEIGVESLAVRVVPMLIPEVRFVPRTDRRDLRGRAAIARRFGVEFQEMPGLCLTLPQAVRLFGVREDICARILDDLVAEGRLIRTTDGVYGGPRPAL